MFNNQKYKLGHRISVCFDIIFLFGILVVNSFRYNCFVTSNNLIIDIGDYDH